MELKIRSDSKAPLDKLAECEVAINVVNKNLSFGSMYVDDGGMIRFRYLYIFFDACPTIGVISTIIKIRGDHGQVLRHRPPGHTLTSSRAR